ncbi:hypothetical protein D3C81_2031550 [compost metagenome]
MPGDVQAQQVDVAYFRVTGAEGAHFTEQIGKACRCCCHAVLSSEYPEDTGRLVGQVGVAEMTVLRELEAVIGAECDGVRVAIQP